MFRYSPGKVLKGQEFSFLFQGQNECLEAITASWKASLQVPIYSIVSRAGSRSNQEMVRITSIFSLCVSLKFNSAVVFAGVLWKCLDIDVPHRVICLSQIGPMTSWHHTLMSQSASIHDTPMYLHPKVQISRFFNLVILTRDLWPLPSNSSSKDIINVNPCAKLCVYICNSSAVRMLTDRQNHRLDWFHTLDC